MNVYKVKLSHSSKYSLSSPFHAYQNHHCCRVNIIQPEQKPCAVICILFIFYIPFSFTRAGSFSFLFFFFFAHESSIHIKMRYGQEKAQTYIPGKCVVLFISFLFFFFFLCLRIYVRYYLTTNYDDKETFSNVYFRYLPQNTTSTINLIIRTFCGFNSLRNSDPY